LRYAESTLSEPYLLLPRVSLVSNPPRERTPRDVPFQPSVFRSFRKRVCLNKVFRFDSLVLAIDNSIKSMLFITLRNKNIVYMSKQNDRVGSAGFGYYAHNTRILCTV
jgi:hypothetical protein